MSLEEKSVSPECQTWVFTKDKEFSKITEQFFFPINWEIKTDKLKDPLSEWENNI